MTLDEYLSSIGGSSLAAKVTRKANDGDSSQFANARKHERKQLENENVSTKVGYLSFLKKMPCIYSRRFFHLCSTGKTKLNEAPRRLRSM